MHFALVEKPGVAPLTFDAAMSPEEKLRAFELSGFRYSQEFFESATKMVRVEDVRVAVTVRSARLQAGRRFAGGNREPG